MTIKTIEVAGFASALQALRLPYNKDTESQIELEQQCYVAMDDDYTHVMESESYIRTAKKDVTLLQMLMIKGDSHCKPQRGILAYLDITVGIGVWAEIETYRAGHERLFSASTMHTEGKGLKGLALKKVKQTISVERPVRKIDYFSYQCLRNIVKQRYNHRDPDWHYFIEHIKTLPLAQELIVYGLDEQIKIHDQMWEEYKAELHNEEKQD